MLTPDDLKAIGALFDAKLGNYPTKSELDAKLEKQKNEIIALVDEKLEAQTKAIDEKLEKQTQQILEGVADFVSGALIPILDKHEKRLEHLERHTEHPPGQATNT